MHDQADKFIVPDDLDLLAFFGGEPSERSVEDGYWCYTVVDKQGIQLRFSFNLYERSVQTELALQERRAAIVSHEGATRMVIESQELRCTFESPSWTTMLRVIVGDTITVEWSTLRIK